MSVIDEAVAQGARQAVACREAGIDPRTLQRWRDCGLDDRRSSAAKQRPHNAMNSEERARIHALLNSAEFRDQSPSEIVPRLADRGVYVASESTMYRVLRKHGEVRRRDGARPATRRRPERHVATGPNQVWCWDISYLRGPMRGSHYYLYLVVDLFSRKVLGAEVHTSETAELAAALIHRICARDGVDGTTLVLHSDNGGPMRGATMLHTLRWLGITASFSRPHVSDDNAYVEALFRTVKYRPGYPRNGFDSVEHARAWVERFIRWYNDEHRHSGIRFVTPSQRHAGVDVALLDGRARVYERAKARRPERWTGNVRTWRRPTEVALNRTAAQPAA